MTSIYVTVAFRDSKMGYEQDVSLGLPTGSSKQARVKPDKLARIRAHVLSATATIVDSDGHPPATRRPSRVPARPGSFTD
ncbi:hypothetical protein [Burkholderia anthina]|uniref:hypothetical protein n=1 Tax=Burkholderia anthina TaxID=179879 RepID=UPI001FC8CBA5|nr:hypothetical protein [Burkholderia anthina]